MPTSLASATHTYVVGPDPSIPDNCHTTLSTALDSLTSHKKSHFLRHYFPYLNSYSPLKHLGATNFNNSSRDLESPERVTRQSHQLLLALSLLK